uniref:Uncharacterized protein n=1 Tax=Tanacetum cinerariifolium TaxID=118510 RepID=A0A699IFH6_TANCI|nr:hypothetical protein [Tanacetum cinerariifolium]
MTRKARMIGNALDAVIRIISLENVQSLHQTRIKKHLSRVLRAILKMKSSTKPTMKLVLWLNHQMSGLELDEWTKYSDCSKHMTGNKSLFSTYKAYEGGNAVFGSNLKGKIIGKGYGPKTSKSVSEDISNEVKEYPDVLLVKKLASDDKLEKETVFPTVAKIEFGRPKQQEKPVRKTIRYAEMYKSQGPRENQRNWNNLKSQQLESNFVMYNKACFVCESFDHVQANCNYHQRKRVKSGNNYTRVTYNNSTRKTHPSAHRKMAPRAVLMKNGLRPLNTARPVNTAHPKTTVNSARPIPQVVSDAKLPILNPNEFDIWKMRIEQYFLMTNYSLWEVILNVDSPALTRVIKGCQEFDRGNKENGFQRGKIDQTLFIKRQKGDILLVQIYVDGIIFGSTNKDLCKAFEKIMKDKFQISSMGKLTFFLGLQVNQKQDEIFISQDKYVAEILRNFGLTDGKSASTPINTEKPLLKDTDGKDVDVHTYRSTIGSLMYLTSSRPDIMFAVCACARF